jgi:hypothetical protein
MHMPAAVLKNYHSHEYRINTLRGIVTVPYNQRVDFVFGLVSTNMHLFPNTFMPCPFFSIAELLWKITF